MSYQVNYRLFVTDCEYWEAELAASLQSLLHEAIVRIMQQNGVQKQVGLSSAEVTYLNK